MGSGPVQPEPNPIVPDDAPRLSLIVRPGSDQERTVECRRVVTLIGTREGCKVVLHHHRVAPVHTALIHDGRHVAAVDLVTRHGTKLNGLKLGYEMLSRGDILTVAGLEFRVEIDGEADGDDRPVRPPPLPIGLERIDGGQVFRPQRGICLIGRRNGCDIVLPESRVSRVHALLLTFNGNPAVFDLHSRNGTRVNDKRVQFATVSEGDELRIGDSRFRVRPPAAGEDGKSGEPLETVAVLPEHDSADLVNIAATEGSQRWRIADKLEKSSRKR